MDFKIGLEKIIDVFNKEEIDYMIVGGFALSYYNRFRFTADIDCVLQIYPHHVEKVVKHFPEWQPFLQGFIENAEKGIIFNLTDFESGVKYDFYIYQDSDYNWTAFNRRKKVMYGDIECYISSPEDLIISKLNWYAISKSAKQLEDIKYLLKEVTLNNEYLEIWTNRLLIKRYGLF
jgi:hypothetical protein